MLERFQSNLRSIRQERGLTIEQLSEETGVATRTIISLEQESGSNPQIATVMRLMKYLDIKFEDLYPA